jgi:hypothetical protein
LHVPRAPAQIARQANAYPFIRKVGIFFQEVSCRQDHPWRAKATLESTVIDECLLQRMKLPIHGETLNRFYFLATGIHSQHHTRRDGHSIDQDGAGTAVAITTTHLGPSQVQLFAKNLQERPMWGDGKIVKLSVYIERYEEFHSG